MQYPFQGLFKLLVSSGFDFEWKSITFQSDALLREWYLIFLGY